MKSSQRQKAIVLLSIIVLFSLAVLLFAKSSFLGFVTQDFNESYLINVDYPVNQVYTNSTTLDLNKIDTLMYSLKMSGYYTGDGELDVYLKSNDGQKVLVYSNKKNSNKISGMVVGVGNDSAVEKYLEVEKPVEPTGWTEVTLENGTVIMDPIYPLTESEFNSLKEGGYLLDYVNSKDESVENSDFNNTTDSLKTNESLFDDNFNDTNISLETNNSLLNGENNTLQINLSNSDENLSFENVIVNITNETYDEINQTNQSTLLVNLTGNETTPTDSNVSVNSSNLEEAVDLQNVSNSTSSTNTSLVEIEFNQTTNETNITGSTETNDISDVNDSFENNETGNELNKSLDENVSYVDLLDNISIEKNETGNLTINQTIDMQKVLALENVCDKTCSLLNFNASQLEIQIKGNLTLKIDSLNYSVFPFVYQKKNFLPMELEFGKTKLINLSNYFVANADVIYDVPNVPGFVFNFKDDIVEITAIDNVSQSVFFYVTNGDELLRSNEFVLSVIKPEPLSNPVKQLLADLNVSEDIKPEEIYSIGEFERNVLSLPKSSLTSLGEGQKTRLMVELTKELPLYSVAKIKEKTNSKDKEKSNDKYSLDYKISQSKQLYLVQDSISETEFASKVKIKDKDFVFDSDYYVKLNGEYYPVKELTDKYVVLEIDLDGLKSLSEQKSVNSFIEDSRFSLFTSQSLDVTEFDKVNTDYPGLDGSGVTVCVIDSGFNPSVIGFPTSQVDGYNFIDSNNDYSDDYGHGTAVTYPLTQAAPGINLLIAKVINGSGIGYSSDVLDALDWCSEQGANIVSFSIGEGLYSGACDSHPVAEKVNNLSNSGILVVASSGNNGDSVSLVNPACATSSLAVGASTKSDELWNGTNYNPMLKMLAPGANIQTYLADGSSTFLSGTSFSSPFVAGAAALLFENNNSLSVDDMKNLLINTGDVLYINEFNFTRLNVYNAIEQIYTNNFTVINWPQVNSTDSVFTTQPDICTWCADCASGYYCNSGICAILPTLDCVECSTIYGYDPQENGEDFYGDCTASYTSCSADLCDRIGGDGDCNGGSYACDTNDATIYVSSGYYCSGGVQYSGQCSATDYCANQYQYYTGKTCNGAGSCSTGTSLTAVASGSVCSAGASAATSTSTTCGTGAQNCWCSEAWYQCDAVNDCNYDRTRVGFTSSGTCVYSASYATVSAFNIANPSTYRCNVATTTAYSAYTSIMDTAACSTTDHCVSNSYYLDYQCNGGTCSLDASLTSGDYDSAACTCDDPTNQWLVETYTTSVAYDYCCGDDGTNDDWAVYSESPLTTVTITACSRCLDGSVVYGGTLYGNGYLSGTTCYWGDIICSGAGASNGASCIVDTTCGYYLDRSAASACSASGCAACPTSCTLDSQCDANAHCDGTCVADLANGNTCDENSDCVSGVCQDEEAYSNPIPWNNNQMVCVPSASYCNSDQSYYLGGSSISTSIQYTGLGPGTGNDLKAVCYTGASDAEWLDCDQAGYMNTWCANPSGTICGKAYTYVGGTSDNSNCLDSQGGTTNGETTTLGDTASGVCGCCGDDYGENYKYRNEYATWTDQFDYYGWGDDTSDDACCGNTNDCVYGATCYDSGAAYDLNSDGFDEAWCYSSNDGWLNTDYYVSYCTTAGYNWNVGYGDATGDNFNPVNGDTVDQNYCNARQATEGGGFVASKHCCCGDDAAEIVNTFGRYTGSTTIVNRDLGSISACCDHDDNCIDMNNNCVNFNALGGVTGGYLAASMADDWIAACGGGTSGSSTADDWLDCDYDSGRCETFCASTGEPMHWVTSGDGSIGEYGSNTDGGNGVTECCGDDADETYRSMVCDNSMACVTDSTAACCDSATDCIDASTCYSSTTTTTHDVGGLSDLDYCSSATWYDCYDTGDCSTDPVGYVADGEACVAGECDVSACTSNDCVYLRNNGYADCDSDAGCLSGNCFMDATSGQVATGACDTASAPICNNLGSSVDICAPDNACGYNPSYTAGLTNYVVSGSVTVDFDNDGDNDYCYLETWYDCNTDAQCGSGTYCSSNNCVACTSAQCATIPQCRDGTGGCCDADSDCTGNQYCDDGDDSGRPYICEDPTTATRGTTYVSGGLVSTANDFGYVTTSVSPTSNFCVRYDVNDAEDGTQYDLNVGHTPRITTTQYGGDNIRKNYVVENLGSWAAATTVAEFEQQVNGHTYYNIMFGWWISEAGATDGSSSSSCCDGSTNCVDDYLVDSSIGCYSTTTTRNTGGGDGVDLEYCSSGTWLAADASSTACSAVSGSWSVAGEVFGFYSDTSTTECCGDDGGENYRSMVCDNSMACVTDSTAACCDSATDCIDASTCYSSTTTTTHDVGGLSDLDYCSSATWYDCYDTGDCSTDPVGYVADGEACVAGECDVSACTSNDCVYLRNTGWLDCDVDGGCLSGKCFQVSTGSSSSSACDTSSGAICDGLDDADMCVPTNACVYDSNWDGNMATGEYVSSGSVTIDIDNDGDNDYCTGSVWYDCSTNTQCATASGYHCVSNDCTTSCTQNSDCPSGFYCDGPGGAGAGTCTAKLSDGSTCDSSVTNTDSASESSGACTSGYCDDDGIGAADDGWCYTPTANAYNGQLIMDNADTPDTCEFDNGLGYAREFADEQDPTSPGYNYDNRGSVSSYYGCPAYSSCWVWISCQSFDGDYNADTCDSSRIGAFWIDSNVAGDATEVDSTDCGTGNSYVLCGNGILSDGYCCGDDAGENYRSLDCDGTDVVGCSDNSSDVACCDTSTDCIADGLCYTHYPDSTDPTTTSYDFGTEKAVCITGIWYDADGHTNRCTEINDHPGWSATWTVAGEVFGEYSDVVTQECCGDDSGENYVSSSYDSSVDTPSSASSVCCNSVTDCVDSSLCTSNAGTKDVGGNGPTDYCSSGTWYDCNSDSDCDTASGYYCDGTPGDCVDTCTQNSDCPVNFYCDGAGGVDAGTCTAQKTTGGTCGWSVTNTDSTTESSGVCDVECRDDYDDAGDGDGLCESGESCWCVDSATDCATDGNSINTASYASNDCWSLGSGMTPGSRALCTNGVWGGTSCSFQPYDYCVDNCTKSRPVNYCQNVDDTCYVSSTNQSAPVAAGNICNSGSEEANWCSTPGICENQYQYYAGFTCDGAGSCNQNANLTNVTLGDVCDAGVSINPIAASTCGSGDSENCYCDETYDCVDNACSANRYLRGFNGTGGCVETGKVSNGTFNSGTSTISETNYKINSSCTLNSDNCDETDHCTVNTYYTAYTCSAGSCSVDVGVLDPDISTEACTCDSATNGWNIGGEVAATSCCEDDAGENNNHRIADSSMDNSYVTNVGDDACCTLATDCVDTSTCYDTGYNQTSDIDGDGDTDYCLAGTWYDCSTVDDCGAGEYCSIGNECILAYPQGKQFKVNDNLGSSTMIVDEDGDVFISGDTYESQGSLNPPANSFIIKDNTGTVVSYVDSLGDMYMLGNYYIGSAMTPSGSNLIIKNTTNTIAYFDDSGNLRINGVLVKGYTE